MDPIGMDEHTKYVENDVSWASCLLIIFYHYDTGLQGRYSLEI